MKTINVKIEIWRRLHYIKLAKELDGLSSVIEYLIKYYLRKSNSADEKLLDGNSDKIVFQQENR